MKTKIKNYRISYLIVSFSLFVLSVIQLVRTIQHLRVTNILLIFYLFIPGLIIYKSANKKKYRTGKQFKRELAEYEKRKMGAEEAGEQFDEEKPIKRPRPVSWLIIITVMLANYPFLLFYSPFINGLYTRRFPHEYREDIEFLKTETGCGRMMTCFPNEIPKKAKRVKWDCFLGYFQADSYFYLSFDAPREYIDSIIDEYADTALVYPYESSEYTQLTRHRPSLEYMPSKTLSEQITAYVMYADSKEFRDSNIVVTARVSQVGFLVNQEKTHIVFYYY